MYDAVRDEGHQRMMDAGMLGAAAAVGAAATAQQTQSPVVKALDQLAMLVDTAHGDLQYLVKKLEPVLGPAPKADNKTPNPGRPALCPLEGRILSAKDGVADLIEKIRMVREALCV